MRRVGLVGAGWVASQHASCIGAESAGVPLAVSQNFRWYPEQQWLAGRVRAGELGPLHLLEHRSFQDRLQAPGVWRAEQERLEV